jgi:O-antigen ligase
LDSAYKVLGRTNNIGYREYLINQVKHQISENFWFGSFFRRSVLVDTAAANLPVHNDFVTITLGGGIISLILYLSIYVVTNYNLLTRLSKILDDDSRKALICLSVLVNCYFFCASANPISMKPQNGMIVMSAIYSIKVMLSSNAIPRI